MVLIVFLIAAYLLYLALERYFIGRTRSRLRHVIHVNGIRGKSTLCRLIHAGLSQGGIPTFGKVTGTDPCILLPDGRQTPIRRWGPANIREQGRMVRMAAKMGADALVIECMAISPELQHVSQHRILQADVGVITNVRWDHADVMGQSLDEICLSLCSTAPRKGTLFTCEEKYFPLIREKAGELGSRAHLIRSEGEDFGFDFPENIQLALAVCAFLGVPPSVALQGMEKYQKDPFSLSVHRVGKCLAVNGLSINDPDSTERVWLQVREKYRLAQKELILLINNRGDRGSRAQDMLEVCRRLAPGAVWLMGSSRPYMKRQLKGLFPHMPVHELKNAGELDFAAFKEDQVLFAVGNVKGGGRALMERLQKEGKDV